MASELELYKKKLRVWLKEGLAGKYVGIVGKKVLGFSDSPANFPDGCVVLRVKLTSAGAWSNKTDLLNHFYGKKLRNLPSNA